MCKQITILYGSFTGLDWSIKGNNDSSLDQLLTVKWSNQWKNEYLFLFCKMSAKRLEQLNYLVPAEQFWDTKFST